MSERPDRGEGDARAEAALRAVYRERSATPTAALRARVDQVADLPSRRRLAWVRSPVGIAAGVVVAAAFIVIGADRIRALRAVAPSGPGSIPAGYDPAHPSAGLARLSGITFNGIGDVGSRVVLVLFAVILIMALWMTVWPMLTDRGPRPPEWSRQPVSRRRTVGLWAFLLLSSVVLASVLRNVWQPLTSGSFSGSGLGVSEARDDGIDPFFLNLADSGAQVSGTPSRSGSGVFDGPRSVYAVAPGQPLTYVMSVRNTWPIGIRLLGRWGESSAPTDATEPIGSTPTGLSLLRDEQQVLDAGPDATKPFVPVDLAPGEEVTLVIAEIARDCADPTKVVPARQESAAAAASFNLPAVQFVYEAFGIEGIATVGLSPEATVPSNCP